MNSKQSKKQRLENLVKEDVKCLVMANDDRDERSYIRLEHDKSAQTFSPVSMHFDERVFVHIIFCDDMAAAVIEQSLYEDLS